MGEKNPIKVQTFKFLFTSLGLQLWLHFNETCTVALFHKQLEPYQFKKKFLTSITFWKIKHSKLIISDSLPVEHFQALQGQKV